jgi:hypothetical protein
MTKTVVFDLDGTLTHYEPTNGSGDKFSQELFNKQAPTLRANDHIIQLLRWYDADYYIVILTARPCLLRNISVKWLNKHDCPFDDIIMLNLDDVAKHRELYTQNQILGKQFVADFKANVIGNLINEGYAVEAFYDDCSYNVDTVAKELNINSIRITHTVASE